MAFHRSALFILVAVALSFSHAQRSPYAGPRRSYVPVGNKYSNNELPAFENVFDGSRVTNRFDDSSSTQRKVPLDIYGDEFADQYVSTWDSKNQPFWYLNKGILEDFRKGLPAQAPGTRSGSFMRG